jgi:hypothetical protein
MQPRGKRRLAAEGGNLTIELQESFLSQVFRLGRVRRHSQTQGVNAPLVPVIKSLECIRIPLLGSFDGLRFVELVCLFCYPVGQVAFSGRNPSDAANYLYVVWLADNRSGTKVTPVFKIQEPFYRSLDTASRAGQG